MTIWLNKVERVKLFICILKTLSLKTLMTTLTPYIFCNQYDHLYEKDLKQICRLKEETPHKYYGIFHNFVHYPNRLSSVPCPCEILEPVFLGYLLLLEFHMNSSNFRFSVSHCRSRL